MEVTMSEFADIFSDHFTTTVFIYGSTAFLAIYAFAVIGMVFRPSERPVSLAVLPGS
jgi:hypothetical protein